MCRGHLMPHENFARMQHSVCPAHRLAAVGSHVWMHSSYLFFEGAETSLSLSTNFATPLHPTHTPSCRFKDPVWPGAGAPCGRYIMGSYKCWLVVGSLCVCTSWMATQRTLCMLVWNASLSLLMLVIFKGLLIAACVFVLRARGSDSLYKFTDLERSDWLAWYAQQARCMGCCCMRVPGRQPNSLSPIAGGTLSLAGLQGLRAKREIFGGLG